MTTISGIFFGAFLAYMAVAHGFFGFLVSALFMSVGALLGRAAAGKLDLKGMGQALIGKHTTTSD